MSDATPSFETTAIRTQAPVTAEREHSVPLFLTSSFRFDDAEHARALFAEEVEGNIYSRYANPNTDEFIRKLALLEGAEDGVATASGMSAVFTAIAAHVSQGDHVLASRALFGSTHQILTRILPRWGVSSDYVDGTDVSAWERMLRPETRMLFIETPSNPGLDILDIRALGALAASRNIPLVVDNCFATPYLQRPIELGAHVVVHSATKYIDGQGRVLGGGDSRAEGLRDRVPLPRASHGAGDECIQCVGAVEVARNAGRAHGPPLCECAGARRALRGARCARGSALSVPAFPPAARSRPGADVTWGRHRCPDAARRVDSRPALSRPGAPLLAFAQPR